MNPTKQRVWLQKAWKQVGAGMSARVVRIQAPEGAITVDDTAAKKMEELHRDLSRGRVPEWLRG